MESKNRKKEIKENQHKKNLNEIDNLKKIVIKNLKKDFNNEQVKLLSQNIVYTQLNKLLKGGLK